MQKLVISNEQLKVRKYYFFDKKLPSKSIENVGISHSPILFASHIRAVAKPHLAIEDGAPPDKSTVAQTLLAASENGLIGKALT